MSRFAENMLRKQATRLTHQTSFTVAALADELAADARRVAGVAGCADGAFSPMAVRMRRMAEEHAMLAHRVRTEGLSAVNLGPPDWASR